MTPSRVTARAKRIRVVHLIHTIEYGGPETILLNWIRSLDPSRYESRVLCFTNPGDTQRPFLDAAASAGITVDTIAWNRRKPVLRCSREMARIVRDYGANILHCYNTYADVVGVFVKLRTRIKIVTTMWMWGDFGWPRAGMQVVQRLTLPFFDVVTAQSEDARRATVQPGLPAEQIPVLTGGMPENKFRYSRSERDRRRAELGVKPEDVILAHAARFWPEKAHDNLLLGFKKIVTDRPQALLWLIGIGPERARIEKLATDLGVAERARFLGFRSDLEALLPLADIQVHPSDVEGIPLAICTGMAAGLPVVASRVGGVPEVVRPGISGSLVEPRQPRQFAEEVIRFIDDESLRRRYADGARRIISEEYSEQAAANRLAAVYEQVLNK